MLSVGVPVLSNVNRSELYRIRLSVAVRNAVRLIVVRPSVAVTQKLSLCIIKYKPNGLWSTFFIPQ